VGTQLDTALPEVPVNRTAALLAGAVAVVGVAAPHAVAAPKKKPITKTYAVTAPMPDPSNYAGAATGEGYSVCAQNVPQSFHKEVFKVPAAGSLKIELTGYQGDWDLLLMDAANEELAAGGATDLAVPEVIQYKFKKATSVTIVPCNWAGGPTGQVKYTFTYK
jgi:hypothetical protein